MAKALILLRGASGSGKSTLAKYIAESSDFIEVCADDFMTNRQGQYEFDVEKLPECHEQCRMAVRRALKSNHTVIVHNVSPRQEHVKEYKDIAEENNALFYSLIVENYHGHNNTHGVEKHVVRRHAAEILYSAQLEYDGL